MAKVIIGIHGLGNKPSKDMLETWWTASIKEGVGRINKHVALPVFKMVYWADLYYDKPLNPAVTDKDDPCYLDEPYLPVSKKFIFKTRNLWIKIVPFVIRHFKKILLNQDFSLKYPQLMERVVDHFFHELEIYYKGFEPDEPNGYYLKRKAITERTVSLLRKHKKDDVMLIGHSMGSIIAFDVLCSDIQDIKIHTLVTIGSPLGQPYVLSKIAQYQQVKHWDAEKLKTPSSLVSHWFNLSDIEDTIALNYKLSDEFCENHNGVKPIDILVNNNYVIRNRRNPHKSFGYLRTKEFSEILQVFMEEKRPPLLQRILLALEKWIQKTK